MTPGTTYATRAAVNTILPPVIPASYARLPAEADTGGLVAPWWNGVTIERVSTADGRPLSRAYVNQYEQLLKTLTELVADGEIPADAANAARRMLLRAMFAGAVAPRLTWHGGDAVVLFWTVDRTSTFFTISADGFSCLKECDGFVTHRTDDLPFEAWDRLFPLVNGIH